MIPKPIVVGVDGSPASIRAAALGWRLAAALDAPCRLIHVVDDGLTALVGLPSSELPDITSELVRDARARLTDALQAAVPARALAALEVRVGRPDDVLASAGAGAELVLLGAKKHAALVRGLGMTTVHQLVHRTATPVLVVDRGAGPIRRVLAAVDVSPAARPTVAAARRLARAAGAELRVMHVIEPVHASRPSGPLDTAAVDRAAVDEFARLAIALPGVSADQCVVRHGAAAVEIARECGHWQADVVVLGSHGKGWLERVMMGSVAERILAVRPAAVMVVPLRAPVTSPRAARTARRAGTIIF
jgi:nucleotide-binding universal stress UspA family protein